MRVFVLFFGRIMCCKNLIRFDHRSRRKTGHLRGAEGEVAYSLVEGCVQLVVNEMSIFFEHLSSNRCCETGGGFLRGIDMRGSEVVVKWAISDIWRERWRILWLKGVFKFL